MQPSNSKIIYTDRIVHLDGLRFDQCTFEGCRLVYSGGESPIFFRCSFKDVSVAVEGQACHTIAFLQLLFAAGLGNMAVQILSLNEPNG